MHFKKLFLISALLLGSSFGAEAPVEITEQPTEFPTESPVATESPIPDTEFPTESPVATESPIPDTEVPTDDFPSLVPSVSPTTSLPPSPSLPLSLAPSVSQPETTEPSLEPTTNEPTTNQSLAPTELSNAPTSIPTLAPTQAPTTRNAQALSVAPQTMRAEGQLLINTTCPSDNEDFEDNLAFALANATNATNVTIVFDHCDSSYAAANYTLILPLSEADEYDNVSSLASLSTAVAAELRNRGYNNSGVDMLVTMLLFNPIDGEECTLEHNDSDCQNGEFLRSFEVTIPAKFGGNCTIPEFVILSCNNTNTSSDSDLLSGRQIAGIVVGSVAGFFLLCLCLCLCCRHRSRSRRASKDLPADHAQAHAVKA